MLTLGKLAHVQTINFFDLGSKLSLVDLPGYGFAHAKEEVKDAWEELVRISVLSFRCYRTLPLNGIFDVMILQLLLNHWSLN